MRDRFRFRVWDTYNERFMYEYQSNPDFAEIIDDSNYTFEQCTGLKDKYGNLIYEGDIIRGVWKDVKIKYVVKFHKCNAQFILEIPNEDSLGEFDLLESDHLEIIGNIHNTPELLEENNG